MPERGSGSQEPLVRELVDNTMRDESRHVAFGVLSLRSFYKEMPENQDRLRRGAARQEETS